MVFQICILFLPKHKILAKGENRFVSLTFTSFFVILTILLLNYVLININNIYIVFSFDFGHDPVTVDNVAKFGQKFLDMAQVKKKIELFTVDVMNSRDCKFASQFFCVKLCK